MLHNWNYANYTKAIVPLALAGGAFLVGWVDAGELNRAELGNVIWLAIAALLVFLAPNTPGTAVEKELALPNDPNRSQSPPITGQAPTSQANQASVNVRQPLAEEETQKVPTRRRRASSKE
jgi:hypothetical protein